MQSLLQGIFIFQKKLFRQSCQILIESGVADFHAVSSFYGGFAIGSKGSDGKSHGDPVV